MLKNNTIHFFLIGALLSFVFYGAIKLHEFLAISKPVDGDIIIVENWLKDYMIDEAVGEIVKKNYEKILIVIHVNKNELSDKYSANNLIKINYFKKRLQDGHINLRNLAIAKRLSTKNNNTYNDAQVCKKYIEMNLLEVKNVNVFSGGPHGRKTYVTFKKVFGEKFNIGIISSDIKHYDKKFWFLSKTGIASTLKNFIGYIYAIVKY